MGEYAYICRGNKTDSYWMYSIWHRRALKKKNSGHTHGEDESSTSRQLFVSLNQTGGDFLSTKGENRKWQNKRVHFSLSSLSFICPSAKEEWCATVFLLCWLTQPLTHTYTPSQTSSAALFGPHCGCLCAIWWMTPPFQLLPLLCASGCLWGCLSHVPHLQTSLLNQI